MGMLRFRTQVAVISLLVVYGANATAQDIYAAKYPAIFTAPPRNTPTSKTPDAPLAGNGDIGLTLGGGPDKLCFYLGKNDFWRAYPVYPGGGIAFPGALSVSIDALEGASYHAEQLPGKAMITGKFVKDGLRVDLQTWVSATSNFVMAAFTSNQACTLRVNLWSPTGNTSVNEMGTKGAVRWVTRSFENTELLEWPAHVAIAMKMLGRNKAEEKVMLQPGQPLTIVMAVFTNYDRKDWKAATIKAANDITQADVDRLFNDHQNWWRNFWQRSTIRIDDPELEKYYFASQYLFACSTRGNKFAPGIWGPFITKDSTAWGGDYHLNYNYQAPFWAAYSSNYIDLVDNYDQPLLDYMPKGRKHAADLLHVRGIYYPVGIGPMGLVTTRWPLTPDEMEKRYGTRENTIDSGYKFLGQKINAVFGAGNMFMRFYSTYDTGYALRVYPYLLACADFWEDYLRLENGRYVIDMDHFNEVMPRLGSTGNWRDRLGDFNSVLSLGLVKMLFRGLIDMSSYLKKDEARQKKWKDIVAHLASPPVGEADGRMALRSVERNSSGPGRATGLNRVAIHGLILPGGVAGPETDSAFNRMLWNDIDHWKDKKTGPGTWGNTLGNGIETCFPGAVRVGYPADTILKELKERIAVQSLPNLWITQAGGGIETLAAVPLTINEMLLQSYEGIVRVFPDWDPKRNASFENLRAYGAFLVSSSLSNGKVVTVQLKSEKGRPCTMENPWPGKKVRLVRNGGNTTLLEGRMLRFPTAANETIVLTAER